MFSPSKYRIDRFLDLNDRSWQRDDVIYLMPDGSAFFTPDGEGRLWYDTEDEAVDESGLDTVVDIETVIN